MLFPSSLLCEEQQLASQLSWPIESFQRTRRMFEKRAVNSLMPLTAFQTLLCKFGLSVTHSARYCHVLKAQSTFGSPPDCINYAEFLFALALWDPNTPHGGEWGRRRAHFIFQLYDVDGDGVLSFNDFKLMVRHLRKIRKLPVDDAQVHANAQELATVFVRISMILRD